MSKRNSVEEYRTPSPPGAGSPTVSVGSAASTNSDSGSLNFYLRGGGGAAPDLSDRGDLVESSSGTDSDRANSSILTDEGVSSYGSASNSSNGSPIEGREDPKEDESRDFLSGAEDSYGSLQLVIANIKDADSSNNANIFKQSANFFLVNGFNPDLPEFNNDISYLIQLRDRNDIGFLEYVIDSNNMDLARFLYDKFDEAKTQFNSIVRRLCAGKDFTKLHKMAEILPQGFVFSNSVNAPDHYYRNRYSSFLNDYAGYSNYFEANAMRPSRDFNFGVAVKSGCGVVNIVKILKTLTAAGYGGLKVADDYGCSGLFYAKNFNEYAIMALNDLVTSTPNVIGETVLDVMAQAVRSAHHNIERPDSATLSVEDLEDKRVQLENELVAKFLFGNFTWKNFSDLCSWYQLDGSEMIMSFFKSDFLQRNSAVLESLDSNRFNLYEKVGLLRFPDLSFFFIRDSSNRLVFESEDARSFFDRDLKFRFDPDQLKDFIDRTHLLLGMVNIFLDENGNQMLNIAQSVKLTLDYLGSNFADSEVILANDGVYHNLFYMIDSEDVSDEKKLQSFEIVKQMMDFNIVPSKKDLPEVIFSSLDHFLRGDEDYLDISKLLLSQQKNYPETYSFDNAIFVRFFDIIESETVDDDVRSQSLEMVKQMIDCNIIPGKEQLLRVASYFSEDYLLFDEEAKAILRKLLTSGFYNLDEILINGGNPSDQEFLMALINREVAEISSFADLVDFQNVITKEHSLYEIGNAMLLATLGQKVQNLLVEGYVPQSNLELSLAMSVLGVCSDISHNSGVYDKDYDILTGATSIFHEYDYVKSLEYTLYMGRISVDEREKAADRFSFYHKIDADQLKDVDSKGLVANLILKTKSSFGDLKYVEGVDRGYIDEIRSLVLEKFAKTVGTDVFDCFSDTFDPNFYMDFFNKCVLQKVFPDTDERFEMAMLSMHSIWGFAELRAPESLFDRVVILKNEVEDVMISFQEGCMDQLGPVLYDFLPTPNDPVFAFRLIKQLCKKDLLPDSQERLDIAIEYLSSFYSNPEVENRDAMREEVVELASSLITNSGFGVNFSLIMQENDFVAQIAKKIGNSDFIFSSNDIEPEPMTYRRFSVGDDMRGQSLEKIREESKGEVKKIAKFPNAKPLSRDDKDRGASVATVLFASLLFWL